MQKTYLLLIYETRSIWPVAAKGQTLYSPWDVQPRIFQVPNCLGHLKHLSNLSETLANSHKGCCSHMTFPDNPEQWMNREVHHPFAVPLGTPQSAPMLYKSSMHRVWLQATDAFPSFPWRQELSLVGIKRPPISAPTSQLQNQGSLRYHFSGELLQMPIPLTRIKNPDLQVLEVYFHTLSLLIRLTSHNYFRHGSFQLSFFPTVNRNTAAISSEWRERSH